MTTTQTYKKEINTEETTDIRVRQYIHHFAIIALNKPCSNKEKELPSKHLKN